MYCLLSCALVIVLPGVFVSCMICRGQLTRPYIVTDTVTSHSYHSADFDDPTSQTSAVAAGHHCRGALILDMELLV
jgi:hypothetical protein